MKYACHPRRFVILILLGAMGLPAPAIAEAVNGYEGLGRALALLALCGLAYLGVAITLMVLAAKRRWRGFRILGLLALAVVVVFPLADSALLKWQERQIKAAEIRKPAPDLREKTILYITLWNRCFNTQCEALIRLQDNAPLWTIPVKAANAIDFTKPIALDDLPLIQLAPKDGYGLIEPVPEADMPPRPEFDYIVVSRSLYYKNRASSIFKALPRAPSGLLFDGHMSILDLAAPISGDVLDFNQLEPDLLTFYSARKAHRLPFFVGHTWSIGRFEYDWRRERARWYCSGDTQISDAQHGCYNALR